MDIDKFVTDHTGGSSDGKLPCGKCQDHEKLKKLTFFKYVVKLAKPEYLFLAEP